MISIWLDDVRKPLDGYIWVKSAREALWHLASGEVEHASLDHDLGYVAHRTNAAGIAIPDYDHNEVNGSSLAISMLHCRIYPTKSITVHSFNPVGGRYMMDVFNAAKRLGATFELYYRPSATP